MIAPRNAHPFGAYGAHCRPKVAELLTALGLDARYVRASGTTMHRALADGGTTPVLDLVGGFGTGLLGHNHPELKACIARQLEADTPFMAQSAIRDDAGRLGARLSALMPGTTGYRTHLVNSGAEAIEAALKHAYKVRYDANRRVFEDVCRRIEAFYRDAEERVDEIELPGDATDLNRFRDDLDELNLARFEDFERHPEVLALKGGFHGKTASALKCTFNKSYREGFQGLSAIRTTFLDVADLGRVDEIMGRRRIEFLVPTLRDGRVDIEKVHCPTVIALVLEPLQGEGGIRPVPDAALRALAESRNRMVCPLIVDEIQTGCGRTGDFVAFAATPLAAIEPEYVTLGKALGGGMVKIAATLIRADVYDPDFGLLHTSTFSEDEWSCGVARAALDILTRDDGAVMREIRETGDAFRDGLDTLRAEFPDVVADVRGRGLMLGIELAELRGASHFLRVAARQGFLSLLIASYLLHHHGIRILAPLTTLLKGNPGKRRVSVLRIQPAHGITPAEIDRVLDALREVFTVVARNNEGVLIGHLLGAPPTADERTAPATWPGAEAPADSDDRFDARVGFVMHPTHVQQVVRFYLPSLKGRVDESVLEDWWSSLARFVEPHRVHATRLESQGFALQIDLVAIPYLPRQIRDLYVGGKHPEADPRARFLLQELRDKVQDAVTVAKELGDDDIPTALVGLGAYTSIVTERGTLVNDFEVPVTTGNAYTAGLMVQGILRAAHERGLDLDRERAAVVGAAGNIGAVLSAMLAGSVGSLRLIGRPGDDSLDRLRATRRACLTHLARRVREQVLGGRAIEDVRVGGVGDRILAEIVLPALADADEASGWSRAESWLRDGTGVAPELVALVEEALDREGGPAANPFITVHDSVDAAGDCHVVTVATSSPEARLVSPDVVPEGAVVSCASVPSNLSRAFHDHTDRYTVFDGGYARLPEGQVIDCEGLPRGGLAFGCLSETLLLGFDGCNRSFARGRLSPDRVEETLRLAELYGFELGDLIVIDSPRTTQEAA
jgi:acetylornithine/succinyldiaminopimelate/putrescine aminotransferase/predicted amino acid dehydrogenase